jgi:hypothetical protein
MSTNPTTFAPRDRTENAAGLYHRMPVGFGPFPGPRQIPHPGRREPSTSRRTVASVTYLTERDAIRELLPPCFAPGADPTVTVEIQKLENLDWLAGRGYSTLGVKFPAVFAAAAGDVEGDFLAVLWENLADPIISGREELGFAKLWCDIDETASGDNEKKYSGSWLGHHFAELELTGLREATGPAPARRPLLHYKYIPKTGCPGEADAAYAVMTPAENPHLVVDRRLAGEGRFKFRESGWEDLPTLFHIVNPLSRLPLKEFRAASLVCSHGGKDLSDQTILT